jgi:hypothetical protein
VILSGDLTKSVNTIDLGESAAGLYFLTLRNAQGSASVKLIRN